MTLRLKFVDLLKFIPWGVHDVRHYAYMLRYLEYAEA